MKRIITAQVRKTPFILYSPQAKGEMWKMLQPPSENWKTTWPQGYEESIRQTQMISTLDPQKFDFIIQHLTDRWYESLSAYVPEMNDLSHLQIGSMSTYSDNDDEEEIRTEFANEAFDTLQAYLKSSGIDDKKVSDLMYYVLDTEVNYRIAQLYIQNHSNDVYYVRVYGIRQAYGGPEEGGWWYNHLEHVDTEQIRGLQNAIDRRYQLQDQLEAKGEDTFLEDMVSGYGGVREMNEIDEAYPDLSEGYEQEGMIISPGWMTSGFKQYQISVEASETPKGETTERPHYE